MELAQRTKIAISWWLASELVRRHPELTVVETHPGDGTYDCLELLVPSARDGVTRIVLNRAGSAHVVAADSRSSSLGDIWS